MAKRKKSVRHCLFFALVLPLFTLAVQAQQKPPDEQASSNHRVLMLPGPASPADFSQGSVMFVGTATVLIRYAGFTVLTDPNFLHKGEHVHLGYGLTSERLTNPAIEFDSLPEIDLVLLSHLHGDHFDQLVAQKLRRDMPIITTPQADRQLGAKGFTRRFGLDTWDSISVRKGDATLRITAMPARHGPPVLASALPETMGSMLDFVAPQGNIAYRTYVSGDTLMFSAIGDIPRRYPDVDLALLHLGGTRILNMVMVTMDAKQGVQMMRLIAPKHAVPIHFNDYDVFKSPIEDFESQAREAGLLERLTFLKHGERYEFKRRP